MSADLLAGPIAPALSGIDWHAAFAAAGRNYLAGVDDRGLVWVARRKRQGADPDVILAAPTGLSQQPPDDEAVLRELWWRTAWPEAPRPKRGES